MPRLICLGQCRYICMRNPYYYVCCAAAEVKCSNKDANALSLSVYTDPHHCLTPNICDLPSHPYDSG